MNPIQNDPSQASSTPIHPDRSAPAHDAEDSRLLAAVQEYMRALESGQHPNRREFLARYADIADELAECLDGLAFVHSAAGEIPGAAPQPRETRAPEVDLDNARPLGDFRLIREIGRGGMGVVYEAIQLTLGRRVAVKVLPMAAALDVRHLERFRNEAQAAAQLHHTNIVPVYAVGCDRSVHFYAMQLIEGQSLAEVIKDLRRLAGSDLDAQGQEELTVTMPAGNTALTVSSGKATPHRPPHKPRLPDLARSSPASAFTSQNLSTLRTTKGAAYARSVAALGLQVAEALDYAHRAGIVHRDIKPANLLLDSKGTLWVTDFGLAQFYTEHNLTISGDMIGTMRYMSPEQASGRAVVLDQRTDIYSLGVTLYELLTLERALPGVTHAQLLDQLANYDPRPARSVDKTIPRELEIILAKAMAKDPADRYQSAELLGADLRRFLADEPIHARPPSAWDKAVKWTRRHRSLALSTLVTLALAAIGLAISTLMIAREQGRTKTAYALEIKKATEANEQRARAEKSSRQAREAVDFFSRIADTMNGPQFSAVRREMLEESLSYYQTFLEERSDDKAVNAELDAAKARVTALLGKYSALDASLRAEARLEMINEKSVQDDLKLSDAEATQAKKLQDELNSRRGPDFLDPRQMTPEQRLAHATEIDQAVNNLLGTARATRLKQIERQARGPLAFGDSDIADMLGLTREQRTKIRLLRSNFRDSVFKPGSWQKSFDQLRREATDNILAELTPSQTRMWQELTGAPFTGKIAMGMFDFGPRGGPGRRDGPGAGGPRHDGLGGRGDGFGHDEGPRFRGEGPGREGPTRNDNPNHDDPPPLRRIQ